MKKIIIILSSIIVIIFIILMIFLFNTNSKDKDIKEVKENEMEKMPKEDLETQLSLLYEIEEKIRNKQEYDISKQNDYFSKITKELEKYSNKIRMR